MANSCVNEKIPIFLHPTVLFREMLYSQSDTHPRRRFGLRRMTYPDKGSKKPRNFLYFILIFFNYICAGKTESPHGIQNRNRRPLCGHRLWKLGDGHRRTACSQRPARRVVCPQSRGARIAVLGRPQPPLSERSGVRPQQHRPLFRPRRRGARRRHRDPRHAFGLPQGFPRPADRSAP